MGNTLLNIKDMKTIIIILTVLISVSAAAQKPIRDTVPAVEFDADTVKIVKVDTFANGEVNIPVEPKWFKSEIRIVKGSLYSVAAGGAKTKVTDGVFGEYIIYKAHVDSGIYVNTLSRVVLDRLLLGDKGKNPTKKHQFVPIPQPITDTLFQSRKIK